jgi:regulator of replication initiation timing
MSHHKIGTGDIITGLERAVHTLEARAGQLETRAAELERENQRLDAENKKFRDEKVVRKSSAKKGDAKPCGRQHVTAQIKRRLNKLDRAERAFPIIKNFV